MTKLTKRERQVLKDLSYARSIYLWAPKTCASLAAKALAECVNLHPRPGYYITDAGRTALKDSAPSSNEALSPQKKDPTP
jgi:hypothetical protein